MDNKDDLIIEHHSNAVHMKAIHSSLFQVTHLNLM